MSEVYCERCGMTEALHHIPNIYTGRCSPNGIPYPEPCDRFTPPGARARRCFRCRRNMLLICVLSFFGRRRFYNLPIYFHVECLAQPRPVDLQTGPQKSPRGDHHE